MNRLSPQKPTILLISFVFSPNIGGVESHLDDLVSSLLDSGYNIRVITYQPLTTRIKAPFFERAGACEIRRLPWIGRNLFHRLEKIPILEFLYLVPPILFYSIFYLMRHRKTINVIQGHGFNMAAVGAILALLFRKKLVVNTHVSFHFVKGTLYASILSRVLNVATYILVLTKDAKDELIKIGVVKDKILIYHQWVDTRIFTPHDRYGSRRRLGLPIEPYVILFVGRLIAQKGIGLLLQAARHFPKNTRLVIIGSGPLADTIESQSHTTGSILFIGKVPQKDLPYYYSAADMCVIPSTQSTNTYAEGIPRVLIESLTCGTPVITTETGGLKRLLRDDIGLLIQPTSEAIVQAVKRMCEERNTLPITKKDCIAYAKSQFSRKNNMEIIEKSLL